MTRLGAPLVTRTLRTMGDRWLPYSAAALASGAVALVLGTLGLPLSPDDASLLRSAQVEEGRWVMASAAFVICALGLGMGLPTFLYGMRRRGRIFGYAGTAMLGIAAVAMASYAALLAFFRLLVVNGTIGREELALLTDDRGLIGFMMGFVGAFHLAEVLLAIGMLRARSVPRWVPGLFLLHAAMAPFTRVVPSLSGIGAVLVGVAFMGVAVFTNEQFQLTRAARAVS
jgi:hypothetical protein